MISKETFFTERLRRQHLLEPVQTPEQYLALFSLLQPVAPPHFSYPGSPPSMTHRTAFDDMALAGSYRERRELIKGRFLQKTIGYVLERDLALYANAFRRPLESMNWQHRRVYDALATTGPLTPRQLAEETGMLNKEIMPALHRLQEAFLVYEDQLTTDWERGWYIFNSEWPEVRLDTGVWQESAGGVLLRFLTVHLFATAVQIKDWSGWTMKEVVTLLAHFETQRTVKQCTIPGLGEGWLRAEDAEMMPVSVKPTVFMLHKSDPLVRSHASALKARYRGVEVLQYLFIDGHFQGAVLGHWRIGPHDVEDIIVELPEAERSARKQQIVDAVAWGYQPPFSHLCKYDGKPV